jgi:predicted nucleic acid-binding protein
MWRYNDIMIRAVIDTNVVFEGLTKRNSASTLLLNAWHKRVFQSFVSLALQYEYFDVLSRKLSPQRWHRIQPALGALLATAEPVIPYYLWRPTSPDVGDDFLIDCAMNAKVWLITYNLRDFALARLELGLIVLRPEEFLVEISK